MTVSDSLPKKRLKIKFSSKDTEYVLESGSREISQQLWINEDCAQNIFLNGKKESMMKKSEKAVPHSSDSLKLYGADNLKVGSPTQNSCKRGPSGLIDSFMNKRQKMDRSLKRHCGSILEALIKHPAAWGFREPVDPEKLNIPDYFSVISKPMDLGTVRTKLQDNMYFSAEEFKDDVKLTFSNAMLYNPPDNIFNKNAKKLDNIFSTKLESLEARLKRESINREESCLASCVERKTIETRHLCPRRSPVQGGSAPTMSVSFEEKRKLTKERGEGMRGKMPEKLKTSDARAANDPAKYIQNSRCTRDVLQKGVASGNRSTCGSVKTIASLSVVATRCRSCDSLKCQCSPQNGYPHAASKNSASERYMRQDCVSSKMDQVHESRLLSITCKSDPESDGAVSSLDEENICSSPQPSSLGTTAPSADGWAPAIDLQLSPKKALRAAMLKSRFVDTILKAKQKKFFDHADKVDPVKLRQEKEKLERQQQEEKARIEAQIRAAEAASLLKAQEELRMRREREREAARIALQKMEKTVEIDNNLKILEELDMFILSMPSNHFCDGSHKSEVLFEASQGGRYGNILERLGLFMKDDYMDLEDEEDGLMLHDMEDGQICS